MVLQPGGAEGAASCPGHYLGVGGWQGGGEKTAVLPLQVCLHWEAGRTPPCDLHAALGSLAWFVAAPATLQPQDRPV